MTESEARAFDVVATGRTAGVSYPLPPGVPLARAKGWGFSALRVLELAPGGSHTFATGESEWLVLPLAGGCTVASADEFGRDTFRLHGRDSVFAAVSDFAYVPRDGRTTVTSPDGGRFALCGARRARRLPARYGTAASVPVELRGRGACSRQVNGFGAADGFGCDRLIAVEVLTPGGNWSSFPPHKHDEYRPGAESALEEIYYFEFTDHEGGPGLGYHRVSPSGRGRNTDALAEVRDGDVVLVPDGWHGPSIAAPNHHMYCLNVMAGPDPERVRRISDHPDHARIRATWPEQPVDPRLPLYTTPSE